MNPDNEHSQEGPTPDQNSASSNYSPPSGSGKKSWTGARIAIAVIVGVVLVVIVAGSGAAFFFRDLIFPQEAGQAAKFLPEDTALFFSVNLRPGAGQLNNLRNIIATYEENPDFQDLLDDFFDEAEDESGIDFEEDIFPWLGSEVAFAISEFGDFEDPEIIFLAATTDKEATEVFIDKLTDFIEDDEGVDFDRDTIRGFDSYHAEGQFGGSDTHIALTDHHILMSTSEGLLKDTIDMIEEPENSLADSEKYIAATAMMLDPRVVTLYVDTESILDDVESTLSLDDRAVLESFKDQIPEIFAMSGAFVDMGVKVSMSYTNPEDAFIIDESNPMKAIDYLPEDTLVMFSGTGFSQIWDETQKQIYDDLFQRIEFEDPLREAEAQFGVDIERDIIDWMTGEITIALIDADISLNSFDEIDEAIVQAVALIEYEDRQHVDDALDNIIDAIEDQGLDFDEKEIKNEIALVADLRSTFGIEDFDLGFMVLPDRVVLGSTTDSMQMVVNSKDGTVNSLSKSSIFERVRGEVEGNPQSMFYANVQGIVETIVDTLSASDRAQYREQAEPFVEPLEAFLVAADVNQDRSRIDMVLTLQQ